MIRSQWAALGALLLALCAGPSRAGDAWMADYRIHDARGDRTLTLVRDDDRAEYRLAGEPIRVWRRSPDGLELSELYVSDRRMVVYAPGDLRAIETPPEWAHLSGLIDPALRAGLASAGSGRAFAETTTRYRGRDPQGAPVDMEWIAAAGLPARLSVGKARGKDTIVLQSLRRVPVAQAFTATDGLLAIDESDLGDMELDPFVRSLPGALH